MNTAISDFLEVGVTDTGEAGVTGRLTEPFEMLLHPEVRDAASEADEDKSPTGGGRG